MSMEATPIKPSDTPRTDAGWQKFCAGEIPPQGLRDAMMQLERELGRCDELKRKAENSVAQLLVELGHERERAAVLDSQLTAQIASTRMIAAGKSCGEMSCDECNARRVELERELAEWRACAQNLAATLRSELRGESAAYSGTGNPCAVDDLAAFDRLKLKSSP